jgi:hypothetical protein
MGGHTAPAPAAAPAAKPYIPTSERIINRNPYLFGPGPIKRTPSGLGSYYGKLPPLQGFSMAAIHGCIFALTGGLIYKYGFGDPQIRTIKQYYIDNPPR